MTLLELVGRLEHVCYRYRARAFLPFLEARGWQVEAQAIPRGWLSRRQIWRAARSADGVLLQRKLLDASHLRALRRNAARLVFDFDDAIFQRASFAERAPSRRRWRRFRQTVQLADVVIAGNDFLAESAARFTDSEKIHVVPTCLQLSDYPLVVHGSSVQPGEDASFEMVWIGSSSTVTYLEHFRDTLDEVGRAVPDAKLKVICDRFPKFEQLGVRPIHWSQETEAAELATADVGVSVLTDDDWSRGKCGLKVLQYMAAGLPVVANPVGVHNEIIEPGRSGILARTPSEWVAAIRELIADRDLAKRMGRRGREIVEEKFSISRWAPRLAELLAG